jgi:hypothetical protein
MTREILIFFIVFSTGLLLATFGAIVWVTSVWEKIAVNVREQVTARAAKPARMIKDRARLAREMAWGRAIPGR